MPRLQFDLPETESVILRKVQAMDEHPRQRVRLDEQLEPVRFTINRTGWGDVVGVALLRAEGRVQPVHDDLTRFIANVNLTPTAGVLLSFAAILVPALQFAGLSDMLMGVGLLIALIVIAWVALAWLGLHQEIRNTFFPDEYTEDNLTDE